MADIVWQGPARGLGVEWVRDRVYDTQRGTRLLWRGRPLPRDCDYQAAFEVNPRLGGYGYDYQAGLEIRPLFWEAPDYDRRGAELAVAAASAGLPEYRGREERLEAARIEREAAAAAEAARREEEARTYVPRAVEAARESLLTMRWAWARQADVAEAERLVALSEAGPLHRLQADWLVVAVGRARDNVGRARAAMAVPYEPEMALAALPDVRAAAHEGCRLLTSLDADWARELNREGWGRVTTVRGHVLAYADTLDETLASHALRVLRRHRRQLPADLDARLFGGAAALVAA